LAALLHQGYSPDHVCHPLYCGLKIKIKFNYRPETPPNTPQRARTAAQQHERDNRTLDSPQRHRIPHQPGPIQIPPLHFNNIPMPQAPFLPGNVIIPDDPFALPAQLPGPVNFNGQQYQNLPQHLAQQLQNVPALPPPPPAQGRGHGHVPPVSSFSLFFFISFLKF